MDNNSMDKQLYDFLNNYNLIQSELNEEEARELINAAMEALEGDENILTGFVAALESEEANGRAFLITDSTRIVLSPEENDQRSSINIENIDSIEIGDGFNKKKVLINSKDETVELFALTESGAESINDALYTALSELLPAENINNIFDMEVEDFEVEEAEEEYEQEPEEEITQTLADTAEIPSESAETIPEMNIIDVDEENINEINEPEASIEPTQNIESIAKEDETPKASKEKETTVRPSGGGAAVAEKKAGFGKKQMLYVLGAAAIILVAIGAFFLFRNISQNSQNNQKADDLINLYNQIDDIYYTAADYQANGGSTPEQWQELDNKALEIQNKLNEFEPTEGTDSLYQAVYFYNDALMTALYYGQSFATTGNPLQQSTLQQRLQGAYQNRLAALSFIESDFPDKEGNITHQTNLYDESISFPQQEEAQRLQEEANSHPSDNAAANRENSESSNEARENSTSSREQGQQNQQNQ